MLNKPANTNATYERQIVSKIAHAVELQGWLQCEGKPFDNVDEWREYEESRASCVMATTPEMAILQIGLIRTMAEWLADKVDIVDPDHHADAIERMTSGLVRFIEETYGIDREDSGLGYYGRDGNASHAWPFSAEELELMRRSQRAAIRRIVTAA